MKKLVQIVLLVVISTGSVFGQQQKGKGRGEAKARIHAAKVAYITDRLQLSEKQMAEFMPVYNNYENELKGIRKSYFKKYKGMDVSQANDATAKQYIDDNLDYQQDVITLKRKYNDSFLHVITPQQLSELNKAEREFTQMLKQRLMQRRGEKGRR
jgi:hypothetical protein